MKKIYLALPYRVRAYHIRKSDEVREQRYRVACRIAKLLTLQGYVVVCPVILSHHLGLPTNWKFWEKSNIVFLEWCDELWIITLSDWNWSDGIKSEIKVAELLDKKIVFIEPNHE